MVVAENYLFSKKIPIGQFFGGQPEDGCVELRETSVDNAAKFTKGERDNEKVTAFFFTLLPGLIVDHDIWKDEAHKYTAEEVARIFASRAEPGLYLMEQWMHEVLFTHGKKSE